MLPCINPANASSITAISKNLNSNADGALAEAVGEKTAGHGKQDKWRRRKQRAHQFAVAMLFSRRQVQGDEHENGQILQHIIAEGSLELSSKQTPKAAERVRRRFEFAIPSLKPP